VRDRGHGAVMSDALMRRLLMERVIQRGTEWLREVLQGAGVTRVSDLPRAALLQVIEERTDACPG